MPPSLSLTLWLALAAPAVAQTSSVLVLSLEPQGIESAQAALLDGMVANAVGRHAGLEVVTARELQQMMELEGSRQTMGCDTASCLAEIAGAMGAQFVVFGKAGRLGELIVVQLNLYDTTKAKAVSREELKSSRVEDIAERLGGVVDRLMAPVVGAPAPAAAAPDEGAGEGPSLPLLWTGGAVGATGAVAAAAGGAWLVVSLANLLGETRPRAAKDAALDAVPYASALALAGCAVLIGGAGLAAAAWVVP
jgi:TolB-like protein